MTAKTDKTPTRLLPHGPAAALREAARRAESRYNGKLKRLLEAVDELLLATDGGRGLHPLLVNVKQARAAFGKED